MGRDARAAAIEDGKLALTEALRAGDRVERMLRVVAAVDRALADLQLRAIVVGGLVVEYWTRDYATDDIDVLLPSSDEVLARLEALGFVRRGRLFSLPNEAIIWEMPGDHLDPIDTAVEVPIPGGDRILMLRREDMIVHRIDEFVGTGHIDAANQATVLLNQVGINRRALTERAQASGLLDALDAFEQLRIRAHEGAVFETDELHALARDLRSRMFSDPRIGER